MVNINPCEIKEISDIGCELSIIIPKEDIQEEINIAYQRLSQKVNLKGFRQGKAPRNILEQHYKGDVTKEVFDKLLQKSLQSAVSDKNLTPVSMPKIESKAKFETSTDFLFTATFQIKPKITVTKWAGLKFTTPTYAVNDEGVEKELKRLQKQQGVLVAVEGRDSIKKGDFIQCKYSLVAEGQNSPGEPQARTIEIGAKLFFPEAEKALVSKKVGEHLAIEVTLPDQSADKKNDDKKAKLSIDIDAIKSMNLPKLDDEFAKDIAEEFSTLDALKKAIKEKHEDFKAEREENEKKDAATEALIKANPFAVPSGMVDSQAEQMAINSVASFDPKQAKEIWAKIGEQIKQDVRPKAEKIVQAALLCEKIAQEQKIVINDKVLDAEFTKEAARMGVDVSTLKARYSNADLENMRLRLVADKAISLVIENAEIKTTEKSLFD